MLTIAYPAAVFFGQRQFEPRWLAGLLLLAVAARLPSLKLSASARWMAAGALLLAACATWANALLPLKLYPVLVNAALLAAFGLSLFKGPPMVERLARLREPDLPPAAIAYTRTVTKVWCGFFVVNGGIALATALWASEALWSLYNGVIAYLLIGTLFAVEWLVRQRLRSAHRA